MFPIVFRALMGAVALTLGCVAMYGGSPPLIEGAIGMFAAGFAVHAVLGLEHGLLLKGRGFHCSGDDRRV